MESRKHRLALGEGSDTSVPEVLTADEAAALLRVAPKFIYAHASALGGWRLLGDRGPWRFRRHELLAPRAAQPGRVPPPRPIRARGDSRVRERTRTPAGAPILPSEPRRAAR